MVRRAEGVFCDRRRLAIWIWSRSTAYLHSSQALNRRLADHGVLDSKDIIVWMGRSRPISVQNGPLVGDWIARGLNGQIGTVGSVVPAIYPAYCRILHPAWSDTWTPLAWGELADRAGGTMHPEVQWEALIGRHGRGEAGLEIEQPLRGRLEPTVFAEICELLMAFSLPSAHIWYFAFWIGWAWSAGLRRPGVARSKVSRLSSLSFSDDELRQPLLDLPPDRQYRILEAPMVKSRRFGQADGPWGDLSTPNVLWPPDHSWCLGTEIDFDSTIVGGSEPLLEELMKVRNVEALSITSDAWLTIDADKINCVD